MKVPYINNPRNRNIVLIILPIIIVTIFILGLQVRSGASDVTTYTVTSGEFMIDIRERGDLEATSNVIVSVPSNVYRDIRIKALVADGSTVKKGDLLVQFDTSEAEENVTERKDRLETAQRDLESTVARIESNMQELNNNLKNQQYSYEQAKIRYDMMKFEADSRKREGEINLKTAELSLKQAEARIESQKIVDKADRAKAEVNVKRAEMRYNQNIDQLNALTIVSPKDGIAVLQEVYNHSARTSEKVKVGDTPHRGMPLVIIPDLSNMIIKTSVNEVDIQRVKNGQKAVITLDAVPGVTYTGTVTGIATLARRDEGTDVKVFDVEINMDNTDENTKPGMSAQCAIITDKISDKLFIPIDSVFERDGNTVVYVKNGSFDERIVKVGKKNSNYIIIEDGLKEGEEVALIDPTIPLKDMSSGQPLAVNK
ncbi:MAG: HlyD family secretion protein [Candidatus Latescibacteria bacterium]|nr:HlyD family secretion protein [Candidatus Latescibacterota bacterium]